MSPEQKRELSEQITIQTESYLTKGGKIQAVPRGVSAKDYINPSFDNLGFSQRQENNAAKNRK